MKPFWGGLQALLLAIAPGQAAKAPSATSIRMARPMAGVKTAHSSRGKTTTGRSRFAPAKANDVRLEQLVVKRVGGIVTATNLATASFTGSTKALARTLRDVNLELASNYDSGTGYLAETKLSHGKLTLTFRQVNDPPALSRRLERALYFANKGS